MTVAASAMIALGTFSGALSGGFLAMWTARLVERRKQAFEREQDARGERAQAMQAARILDSVFMEAEGLLNVSVMKNGRLWSDILAVPDRTVWLELRGSIAAILDRSAWTRVNVGFIALGHMHLFEIECRKLGQDDTTDLSTRQQAAFRPVLKDIRAAREALSPVAFPDHILLPEGHPMRVLLAEHKR